jgi:hypothetical protein
MSPGRKERALGCETGTMYVKTCQLPAAYGMPGHTTNPSDIGTCIEDKYMYTFSYFALFKACELHGRLVDRQHESNQPTRRSSISIGTPGACRTVDHPTPKAVGSLPCTLHSTFDQGVCVALCIRTNGHDGGAAAVAGCDTT